MADITNQSFSPLESGFSLVLHHLAAGSRGGPTYHSQGGWVNGDAEDRSKSPLGDLSCFLSVAFQQVSVELLPCARLGGHNSDQGGPSACPQEAVILVREVDRQVNN